MLFRLASVLVLAALAHATPIDISVPAKSGVPSVNIVAYTDNDCVGAGATGTVPCNSCVNIPNLDNSLSIKCAGDSIHAQLWPRYDCKDHLQWEDTQPSGLCMSPIPMDYRSIRVSFEHAALRGSA